ncbi:MAG: hypothetical protein O3A00_24930 [Planctomycetota bacterium]|nr:hypothetical protein [Planctomycetota bacterium]
MHRTRIRQLALLCCAFALNAQRNAIADELPTVPDGFEVKLFAREPMIRNPASMAFDARGRLFVGQGPQFRSPKPDTPGDEIRILIDDDDDDDDDGVCDEVKGSSIRTPSLRERWTQPGHITRSVMATWLAPPRS